MYSCRKCNGEDMFIEKKSNNTGLYCQRCGAWQKWLSKDEIRLFNYKNKCDKDNKSTTNKHIDNKRNYKTNNNELFDNSIGMGPFDEVNTLAESIEPTITITVPLRLLEELKKCIDISK